MQDPTEPQHPGRLKTYLQRELGADAMAGLTVAIMGVPQAMAYALIAGLPPVMGLYTSIVTCAVAALLGSSRHLVTGPTNGLCMVMASLAFDLGGADITMVDRVELILLLTFISGVIQLGFGVLRLGSIVRYVSSSVVVGFTAGAGILIALNQVKGVLGVQVEGATLTYEVFYKTAMQVADTNPYALGLGVLTGACVVLLPKLHRRIPAALIGVALAGVGCYLLGWHEEARGAMQVTIVQHKEPITGGLDLFHVPAHLASPDLGLIGNCLTGALSMAILGLIEATSISRAIARSSRQKLDFNREFIGQGTSRIVGSFFSCFAGSGSFTRTSLCYTSGGRTRLAAVFSAFWTLLTLLLFGPIANYIPTAALAGLLIVTAYSMIDKARLKMSWQSGRNSQIVLAGTILATLVLPLQYAIFVGVFLSLIVILRTTGKTDLTQLVPRDDSGFDEVPFKTAAPSHVAAVNMQGDIYFAAAEDLDAELLRCLTPKTRVVVLRMRGLRAVGSTAMAMLEHYWTLLREKGIPLVVCGIEKELEDVMTSTGVRKKIGEANIFFADNKLLQATELAMARARSLAASRGTMETTAIAPLAPGEVTAQDLMSSRCIRFGNKHQLREAVWLMSELQKHTKAIESEPLFLQDREGKLFGNLSPWQILEKLAAGANGHDTSGLSDQQVADLLRRDFTKPIRLIAETNIERHSARTPIAYLFDTAVQNDQRVTPICDEDGRLKGLVTTDDLLRGLAERLRKHNGEARSD